MPDLPGLAEACDRLAEGRPVVVPNPSPMTYGVVGPDAGLVNALKQRPPDQSVAISLHDTQWPRLVPALDVPEGALPRIAELLRLRVSLLVPVHETYPRWMAPAVRSGYLAVFRGWWEPAATLWDRFPRLFGSSANRTGQPAAASAAQARATFGDDAPIVDGDALRDPGVAHAPSSMVRVAPDGTVTRYRSGAQDAEVTRYTS